MQCAQLRMRPAPPLHHVMGESPHDAEIDDRTERTDHNRASPRPAPLAHEEREPPQRNRPHPQHPDPQRTVGHQPQERYRDVANARRVHRGQIRVPEVLKQADRVLSVVLERRLRKVPRRVVDLVIHMLPAQRGKVQPLLAHLLERGEVGVVRHAPVDLLAHRVRGRIRIGLPQRLDDPPVVVARLEHHRGAAAAAHLERHHQCHVVQPRMFVHEGARAEQPELLGIGDKHDQVVA